MSRYLILIYEAEAAYDPAPQGLLEEIMREHDAFTEGVPRLGASIVGGEALHPTTTATSIRGGSEVTDGPFVETKEALGGYYVVEAPDLDTALAVARTVPARFGGVEVRPVMTFDG
ncbi:YciI family protein [Aquipuribacter sp. MA13-6]|uniref:YciI family protein n=1 Tax=unclassified Aquipuribacter TaxID=2635084 RepID=UPI003EEF2846